MMADHLDFLDFAGGGNSGMEQSIESIGLQCLLTGFSFFSQNVPFFICEADHDLVVPQAMGFMLSIILYLLFICAANFCGGSKGSEAPLQVSREGDARSIARTREASWMAGAKRMAIQEAKLAYHL